MIARKSANFPLNRFKAFYPSIIKGFLSRLTPDHVRFTFAIGLIRVFFFPVESCPIDTSQVDKRLGHSIAGHPAPAFSHLPPPSPPAAAIVFPSAIPVTIKGCDPFGPLTSGALLRIRLVPPNLRMEELFVAILSMLLVVALVPLYLWKRRQVSRSDDDERQPLVRPSPSSFLSFAFCYHCLLISMNVVFDAI